MDDTKATLAAILARLDRGNAPASKWPDAKVEYWALCPFHSDRHATNFSVSARGYHCFTCGAKGSLADLAQRLGIAPMHGCTPKRGDSTPPPPSPCQCAADRLRIRSAAGLGRGFVCTCGR